MIETLVLMDLHRGVRRHWHIYHSVKGLTLSKLHLLLPSGWSVLVFEADAYTLDQNPGCGEHLPFRCSLDAGACVVSQLG